MKAVLDRRTNWFLVWFATFLLMQTLASAFVTFFGGPVYGVIVGCLFASCSFVYSLRKNAREGKAPPLLHPYVRQWGFLKLRTRAQQRAFAWLMVFLGVGAVGDVARLLRGHPDAICVGGYAFAVATACLISNAMLERQISKTI